MWGILSINTVTSDVSFDIEWVFESFQINNALHGTQDGHVSFSSHRSNPRFPFSAVFLHIKNEENKHSLFLSDFAVTLLHIYHFPPFLKGWTVKILTVVDTFKLQVCFWLDPLTKNIGHQMKPTFIKCTLNFGKAATSTHSQWVIPDMKTWVSFDPPPP